MRFSSAVKSRFDDGSAAFQASGLKVRLNRDSAAILAKCTGTDIVAAPLADSDRAEIEEKIRKIGQVT